MPPSRARAAPATPDTAAQPRRRLSANDRRHELVVHAAEVFAALGPGCATTADVAAAAGVTRALVHHYFSGIAEVYAAVVPYAAEEVLRRIAIAPCEPLPARVARDTAARLDAIKANRGLWLATAGNPVPPSESGAREALSAWVERDVDDMLSTYADSVRDVRDTRAALRAFVRFSDSITRQWLLEQTSRAFAARLIGSTLLHLLAELPGHLRR